MSGLINVQMYVFICILVQCLSLMVFFDGLSLMVSFSCSLALSDEHNCVVGVDSAKIVGTKLISDGPVPTQRVALSVDNHLLILDFTQSVQIIMCTALSGIPMEVCFVGKCKC